MPLTLDATVGGSSSNAYLTAAEGDAYHERRLHATVWTAATDATKEAALVWATQLLDDGIKWVGVVTDLEQALAWPRSGIVDREGRLVDNDAIPSQVKDATAELARLLIASDRGADRDTIGFKAITVGPIQLEVDKLDDLAVIPDAVYDMLREFGYRINNPGAVKMVPLVRV